MPKLLPSTSQFAPKYVKGSFGFGATSPQLGTVMNPGNQLLDGLSFGPQKTPPAAQTTTACDINPTTDCLPSRFYADARGVIVEDPRGLNLVDPWGSSCAVSPTSECTDFAQQQGMLAAYFACQHPGTALGMPVGVSDEYKRWFLAGYHTGVAMGCHALASWMKARSLAKR